MTATERLRRLLDERGVEWDYGITGSTTTRFSVNGIDLTFTPMRDGLVCSTILTPEQAVEATLGRGVLTADDVRDLIERHSDASGGNGRDFRNGAYVAIADELSATLGRGTCQQEEGGWSTEGDHARVWLTCGHDCMVETVADLPNFCPVCGAKVVSA